MAHESADTLTLPDPSRPGRNTHLSSHRRPGAGLGRGARVGRFVIRHALGSGGSGCVYAAHDPELDRPVALKLLADTDPEARSRLLREARGAARLHHPNVVTVYDVGAVDGRPYLAMEQIRGVPLSGWLRESDRSLAEILDVFHQAAQGLQAAHDAGLVHQDFKPGNVMVADDGRAVVVDFGLARPARPRGSDAEGPWPAGGTPPYAAPEQRSGRPADHRSDQYAFCVALACTLRMSAPPRDLPPPPAWAPAMSRRLEAAVRRGFAEDPKERHSDLHPLTSALKPAGWSRPLRRAVGQGAGAFVIVLGFALGAAAAYQASRPPWAGQAAALETRMARLWNPPRADRLRRAYEEADPERAPEIFRQARQRLSEHADAWLGELEAVTKVEVSDPEATLQCLDRFLARFEAVLHTMANPDPRTVEHTARLVLDLEDPAVCRTRPAGLIPREPPRERREIVDRVRAIRHDLHRAELAEAARRYDEALPLVTRAAAKAAALDWPPIHAEALFWQARMLVGQGRHREAHPILLRALRRASEADHPAVAALSSTYLARNAILAHDLSTARDWLEHAEGWLPPLPERHEARSTYHAHRARLLRAEARPGDALEHHRLSLETDPAPTPLERGDVSNGMGIAWYDQEQWEPARQAWMESLEAYGAFYGDEGNFSMVPILANLANLERQRERFDLALLFYQRAHDILETSVDHEERLTAYLQTGIGLTLLDLQRPAEAIVPLEKALEIYDRQLAWSDRGGRSRFALARALWETRGDRKRALELARQAAENFDRAGPVWASGAAEVREWLSRREPAS